MGGKKQVTVGVPAAEFMAKHERELAESEDVISIKLLASLFPQEQMKSLASLLTPSPQLDAWLQAREAASGHRLMRELRQYWLVRLLRAAKKENSPEAYRELLEGWLMKLGAEPPAGVFLAVRRERGAPRKKSSEQAYRIWLEHRRPDWSELAYDIYGADYTRADAKQRKKLRDRCRRSVKRYEAMHRDQKALN
jgi:hypothetical protein